MNKIFCYYDDNKSQYVELEVSLKDDVKEEEVVSFCANISDYDLLNSKINPQELKMCFFNMLESSILSFEEINNLLDFKETESDDNLYIIESSRRFLSNFNFKETNRYSAREYGEMFRKSNLYNVNGINEKFLNEARSTKYNTRIIKFIENVSTEEKNIQKVYK